VAVEGPSAGRRRGLQPVARPSPTGRAAQCGASEGEQSKELYLPKSWTEDRDRRAEAGVPDTVEFSTKPELAQQMLERALDSGMPASWVTGDEAYGQVSALRRVVTERGMSYMLAVPSNQRVHLVGGGEGRIDAAVSTLPHRPGPRSPSAPARRARGPTSGLEPRPGCYPNTAAEPSTGCSRGAAWPIPPTSPTSAHEREVHLIVGHHHRRATGGEVRDVAGRRLALG
jgi:hypothetical protein